MLLAIKLPPENITVHHSWLFLTVGSQYRYKAHKQISWCQVAEQKLKKNHAVQYSATQPRCMTQYLKLITRLLLGDLPTGKGTFTISSPPKMDPEQLTNVTAVKKFGPCCLSRVLRRVLVSTCHRAAFHHRETSQGRMDPPHERAQRAETLPKVDTNLSHCCWCDRIYLAYPLTSLIQRMIGSVHNQQRRDSLALLEVKCLRVRGRSPRDHPS